jgi:hypothetical protein
VVNPDFWTLLAAAAVVAVTVAMTALSLRAREGKRPGTRTPQMT